MLPFNPHQLYHQAVFDSQASYDAHRRLYGLDGPLEEGLQSAASTAATAFPDVVDSIARPLYTDEKIVVDTPTIYQPVFANTGAYVNPMLGYGYGAYGSSFSGSGFIEPLQEEPSVFSVIRDAFFGSPKREYDALNGQNAWGRGAGVFPPAFDLGWNTDGYAHLVSAPRFPQNSPHVVGSSNTFARTGEADSGDVFHDWNSIQSEFLKYSESDVHVDNAVENLSILYFHSATFRDMVASLVNHLTAAKATISIKSGTKVSHGKFHRNNATIELNIAALPEAGKQLATLALHLTNASYLTDKSNRGESSKAFQSQCLALMETYYQQAGAALEEMGLGNKSFWVKSKPSPVEHQEVEFEPPAEVEVPLVATSRQLPSGSTGKKGFNKLWKFSMETLKNWSR